MCKRSLPKVQFHPSFWRQNQTFLSIQVSLLPWVCWECRSVVAVLFCPLVAVALLTRVLYHLDWLRAQNPTKAAGPILKAWGLQTEPGVRGTPCNQASSGEPGAHAPFGVPGKQTPSGGGGHRYVTRGPQWVSHATVIIKTRTFCHLFLAVAYGLGTFISEDSQRG